AGGARAQAELVAERERVQKEIEELEHTLGPRDPGKWGWVTTAPQPQSRSDSGEELDLPHNVETCLQMNLVYQEVLKEKLVELERLLLDNREQQVRFWVRPTRGGFLPGRPVLGVLGSRKDLCGGPPPNSETRDKMSKGSMSFNDVKIKRWEGWHKTLLFNAVVKDTMKRLLQPKISKLEYLTKKMSKASDMEKQILQKQVGQIEREIEDINAMTTDQLVGNRHDDHDWDKISNIDFEGTRNAADIRRFWQNCLHPSVNKSLWKKDEIEKLKGIVEEYKACHWDQIAEKLGTNRTAFMCLQMYQRYINKGFRKSVWSKEEDEVLKELVYKMRIGNFIPYTQISYFMEGRDSSQLIYRWTQVLDPTLRKGHWSKEEDELLLKAVAKYGMKDWAKIRTEVPGRTDGQCRDRYLDCLKGGVKKGPWSKEEDALLIKLVEKHGVGRWAKISTELPNRLDCQCLQRWKAMTGYGVSAGPDELKVKVKVEEEEEDMSTSEDEEQLVFMDSEEEAPVKEDEEENDTKQYFLPSVEEWIPKTISRFPQFGQRVVRVPQEDAAGSVPPGRSRLGRIPSANSLIRAEHLTGLRSTVVDLSGCPLGVVVDSELQPQEEVPCCMVRNPFRGAERKGGPQGPAQHGTLLSKQQLGGPDAPKSRSLQASGTTRIHSPALNAELLIAVLPWVGSLLVPLKSEHLTEGVVERTTGLNLLFFFFFACEACCRRATASPAGAHSQPVVHVVQPGASVTPVPAGGRSPPRAVRLLQPGTSTATEPQRPAEPGSKSKHIGFDPNLMFLEEESQVREWMKGTGGVVLPQLDSTLPYLPPFVSNLATLADLLQRKSSLEMSALQLLDQGEQVAEEQDRVDAVRALVAERFGGNPAYLLLKARFLACFTLPAFLATVHPHRRQWPPVLSSHENSDGEDGVNMEAKADSKVDAKPCQVMVPRGTSRPEHSSTRGVVMHRAVKQARLA
uniref:Small nuclear RNA activating complex, polypeptide 4 n=1 Tax=Scleropages formosus TaxID=113540 RepID=A0A8C9TEJ9_SCLFO